jgi:hypothetical protein
MLILPSNICLESHHLIIITVWAIMIFTVLAFKQVIFYCCISTLYSQESSQCIYDINKFKSFLCSKLWSVSLFHRVKSKSMQRFKTLCDLILNYHSDLHYAPILTQLYHTDLFAVLPTHSYFSILVLPVSPSISIYLSSM